MGIPEIIEQYFCSGIMHDVNDYIRDNKYDDIDEYDEISNSGMYYNGSYFSDYMKRMGRVVCKKMLNHYKNKTDLQIYDELQDPELFQEIIEYAMEIGNEPAHWCYTQMYVICYFKYVEFWNEENIIHTANYLKNSKA
jgi:hypothetical protein